jgi:hypothetical protein
MKGLFCHHGITKGGLELQNSKPPRRTNTMKKVGKQTQLAQCAASAELAVATLVVNS